MASRGKIQEESMYYGVFDQGRKKHDGSLPLIGVNTFLPKDHGGEIATKIELICLTEEEKGQQVANVKPYGEARNALASDSLMVLQQTARDRRNVFRAVDRSGEVQLPGSDQACVVWRGWGVSAEYVRTTRCSSQDDLDATTLCAAVGYRGGRAVIIRGKQ